jgi:hypothetical protein
MKRLLAAAAVLLALGTSAKADSFSATVLNGNIGQDLGNGHYGGTFTVTGTAPPVGPYTAFCADLQDDVQLPSTTAFSGQIYYGPMDATKVPAPIWTGSPFGLSGNLGVGNRLDYVLTQIMAPALPFVNNSNGDNRAAGLQSAIWQIIAPSSAPANTGVTNTIAAAIMNLVNGIDVSNTGWALLNNATPFDTTGNTAYGNSSEFLIVPNANTGGSGLTYQVLVGIGNPVPEPSSLAIAGLGVLGFLGYGLKRRKSS